MNIKILLITTSILISLMLLVVAFVIITHPFGKKTANGKNWEEVEDRGVAKLAKWAATVAIVFVVGILLLVVKQSVK